MTSPLHLVTSPRIGVCVLAVLAVLSVYVLVVFCGCHEMASVGCWLWQHMCITTSLFGKRPHAVITILLSYGIHTYMIARTLAMNKLPVQLSLMQLQFSVLLCMLASKLHWHSMRTTLQRRCPRAVPDPHVIA